ncbi:uncharacterized protein LOC119590508 [Penaeus monodon]|uniref:uncharacterized protein LOC119590508 n=1 Tax=Penaeus monodon TaxID=6687 RepID=UPI0018A77659|nr:uncharacterized protein LOC119590508 [Penaeus monodon]
MLVVQLTSHVSVVTLCGPTPSLADMIRSATSFWAPFYQVLEALSSLLPWNIAPALLTQLDNSVIGLLLVNYDHKRCVGCLHLSEDSRSRSLCVNKKSAALQSVYRSIIGPLLQPPAMPPEDFPTGVNGIVHNLMFIYSLSFDVLISDPVVIWYSIKPVDEYVQDFHNLEDVMRIHYKEEIEKNTERQTQQILELAI